MRVPCSPPPSCAPVVKVGGMGDVGRPAAHPRRPSAHDVRLILPGLSANLSQLPIPPEPIWRGRAMDKQRLWANYETRHPSHAWPLNLGGHPVFKSRAHSTAANDEIGASPSSANASAEILSGTTRLEARGCCTAHETGTQACCCLDAPGPEISTVFTHPQLQYAGALGVEAGAHDWCPCYMQGTAPWRCF